MTVPSPLPARRRLLLALAAASVAALALAPARAEAQPALLGVYEGNQGWDLARVRALESWQGRGHAVLLLFTNWDADPSVQDNLFTRQLPAIWDQGHVPLITWEPYTGEATPPDIVARIAGGYHDAYVATWAARLRAFLAGPDGVLHSFDDRRAFLRLAHEMNGNWYPWGQVAPGDFLAMWRRVRGAFEAVGLGERHLQWVWTVNASDAGAYVAEHYFPGEAWVDWVGIDGFNWGATAEWSRWQSPAEVFDPMLARLRGITARPVAVNEAGSTARARGVDVEAKNAWIRQFFAWAPGAGVSMVCWFNADTDADFAVFGGRSGDVVVRVGASRYRAFSAYRGGVEGNPWLLSADGDSPRLITDEQFAGR